MRRRTYTVRRCERLAMNSFKKGRDKTKEVLERDDQTGHDAILAYRGHGLR